ncbi:MAG: Nramp family divalent metal transporter [Janthinobacterium lividum]
MSDGALPRDVVSSSHHTVEEVREVLSGRRHGLRALAPFAGPAVVVSVAYVDPGNFATNVQAGARYGYGLLWVVVLASLTAMLFQGLSAKLGLVTGKNLAEISRLNLPRRLVLAMWGVSEVAAMATDLAEFLGGAIGFSLLLHVPIFVGMSITAAITFALLLLQNRGFRPLELAIGALVGVIGLAYFAQLFLTPVNWPQVLVHSLKPEIADSGALTLAVGIVGATVMPHALFLHSGLAGSRVEPRSEDERTGLLRYARYEVVIALTVAALVNLAMVIMAAGAFHIGHRDVAQIDTAYRTLTPLFGGAAAALFLLSLIASGVSSSVVGTMAGQMIMQGFLNLKIPLWLRRVVTMVPSFIVVAMGINATRALVLSQVVLSIAVPVPMFALLWFTCSRRVMGERVNGKSMGALAGVTAVAVLALNAILLVQILS